MGKTEVAVPLPPSNYLFHISKAIAKIVYLLRNVKFMLCISFNIQKLKELNLLGSVRLFATFAIALLLLNT